MDQPIKTLVTLVFVFLGAFLMITILTFGVVANNARDVLYTVVDFVEINGYDAAIINDYAQKTHTTINVVETNSGIAANGEKNRYVVSVSFTHALAWLNSSHTLTYRATTKAVDF